MSHNYCTPDGLHHPPRMTYTSRSNYKRSRPATKRKRYTKGRKSLKSVSRKKYRGGKKRTSVRDLKKRVANISRTLKSDQARHTNRFRYAANLTASVAQVNNSAIMKFRTTEIETAMANLRYYDPSVPGTLVTANASTGTYNRQIHFESVYDKLTVRNNYQVPVLVRIWSCTPKADTSIAPDSFYSNGVTDQTIGPIAVTSPLLYPTDIDDVTNNWSFKVAKNILLQPGAQTSVHRFAGPFDYDPSNVDHHNLVFQKKYKAHTWMLRIEGVGAHDSSLAQYGTSASGIDYIGERKCVITYDAGVNLTDFSEDDSTTASFTNAAMVANKPVSDNQSYSVA